jgi:antitoxin-like ribbon-helix-helix protein
MTTKRPPVLALENFLGRPDEPQIRPTSEFQRPYTAPPGPPGMAPVFRTSIYFHRTVHDILRAIARDERKSITELINEGLDHVLAKRNYPGTADLLRKK